MYNLMTNTNVVDNINGRDAVEYAWDFEKNDFKLVNGRTYVVTGIEAVKIWVWKALSTKRNRFAMYTLNYGNEVANVIGQTKDIAEIEAQRYIGECLLVNPYIISVDEFIATILNDTINISFTVNTVYGQLKETTNIYI